ncbi:MAG: hypothetical protein M3O70_13910 [Actinomycetota bacterium]|nr:hypothetical protein [Actinomycetota bacterium]
MPRPSSAVLTALTVLVAACGGMAPTASDQDPEQPTSCSATDPCASPPTEPAGPEIVTPRPGMADVHPVPFDSATPEGDGMVVRVVWWSGMEPCYVLDHVEVAETGTTVTITLYQGHDPAARDVACIELAVQKSTLVELDQPLRNREIVDGAKRSSGYS